MWNVMKRVKTFKSRRRRWKFRVTRPLKGRDGEADCQKMEVLVSSRLAGKERLETILHEFLHTAIWDLGEEAVQEIGADAARLLWRLGYRAEGD